MTGDTTTDLLRRAEDLARRCEKSRKVTHSGFLTPAEGHALSQWGAHGFDAALLLYGGFSEAERRVAFFLPAWCPEEAFQADDYLCALEIFARFGKLGHRDVLGAVLALGIQREWVGDILADGETAYLICLPSVREHLLLSLDKVGRYGVRVREVPLSEVPVWERELQELSFTVKSPRLDAVCAGMFRLSRTDAAEAISQGLVVLNYEVCMKPDHGIQAGDILSLRGKGKGMVLECGDRETRKGRISVRCGRYT